MDVDVVAAGIGEQRRGDFGGDRGAAAAGAAFGRVERDHRPPVLARPAGVDVGHGHVLEPGHVHDVARGALGRVDHHGDVALPARRRSSWCRAARRCWAAPAARRTARRPGRPARATPSEAKGFPSGEMHRDLPQAVRSQAARLCAPASPSGDPTPSAGRRADSRYFDQLPADRSDREIVVVDVDVVAAVSWISACARRGRCPGSPRCRRRRRRACRASPPDAAGHARPRRVDVRDGGVVDVGGGQRVADPPVPGVDRGLRTARRRWGRPGRGLRPRRSAWR